MELFGREIGFKLTVGAACEVAEKCPGGELKNFQQLIEGRVAAATEGRIALIMALSRGYEEARAFEDPGYKPAPITPAQLRTLDLLTFREVFEAAFAAFLDGLQTSVTLKESKKNGDGGSDSP